MLSVYFFHFSNLVSYFVAQGFGGYHFHLRAVFENFSFDLPEVGNGNGQAEPAVYFDECFLRRMPNLFGNPGGNIFGKTQADGFCLFSMKDAEGFPDIVAHVSGRESGGDFMGAGGDGLNARQNKIPQCIF